MLGNLLRQLFHGSSRRRLHSASMMEILASARAALGAGRFDTAEHLAGSVLASRRANDQHELEALCLRARARAKQRKFQGAVEDYEAALRIAPQSIATMLDYGSVLHRMGRFQDALAVTDAILRIDPRHVVGANNRGLMLRELARLEEAETALRYAVQCDNSYLEARANLGRVLVELGRLDEAERELATVIADDSRHIEGRWNRAMIHLLRGEFAAGWQDYESRLERPDAYRRPYRYHRWSGERLGEGALLIVGEQGLGDEILFASCFEDAMARAGSCVIECEPRLERLFARSFRAARVVGTKFDPAPNWIADSGPVTAQIPAGSLPRLFRNRLDDFPSHNGYLKADAAEIQAWRARLDGLGRGVKVGISWTGGSLKTRRASRSLALIDLLPVLHTENAHFVSLQYIDSAAEIEALALSHGVRVHHWSEALDDYDKTAALVSAVDLVISVTTAVVHLAGALGKAVWVLVPSSPEWRYLQAGTTIPWYPSARVYRQSQPGDWSGVIREISNSLENRCVRSGNN